MTFDAGASKAANKIVLGPHDASEGLASVIRDRTQDLHTQAERTGVVSDILKGRASIDGYALYLRSLVPAYRALERGLERHQDDAALRGVPWPQLFRSAALASDLSVITGANWEQALPLLPPARDYAGRIAAGGSDPARLIAHAYVRYMGDLSGGQILKKLLGRSLGLQASGLAFYDFPLINDPASFKRSFRSAIDAAGAAMDDPALVVEEASEAFRQNIAVSQAVRTAIPTAPRI